jgi:hypothetical protein
MACDELLPIYNLPIKYQNDVYDGTGLITVLSAADIYQTTLSAVEYNFTPTTNSKLSSFQWTTPTQIVLDSAANWQHHIGKIKITYEPGLYDYQMVTIDSLADRRTLMTGRFQIL